MCLMAPGGKSKPSHVTSSGRGVMTRVGPPAGVGSRTGDDQGAACPALRELRERAVFAAQAGPGLKDGSSLEANEKAERSSQNK